MAKLSGILEYSMDGFLCLRGYTSLRELSKISECKQSYQRDLLSAHTNDIAAFLNKGEYRFFPEIVLSVSLLSRGNFSEVDRFFETIRRGDSWGSSKLGEFQISVFNHDSGDRNRIAHLSFDEKKIKLNRIDGNHRLSAAEEIDSDLLKTPFCIILCRNEDEESKYSRVIFHNINAKQIPLNLEENNKVIIEDSIVFPDEKLKTDPSFGWEYYLARKIIHEIDYSCFRQIEKFIGKSQYSFFVELFHYLLENKSVNEDEQAVDTVKSELSNIDRTLLESEITGTTENIAVIGALAYYKITNISKYRGFLSWVKRNNIGNVNKLHISDVICLYDEIFEHVPKKAFLARWYPDAEKDGVEADKAKNRIQAMQAVAEELGIELTDLGTRETGTFDIRGVMYRDIRECDIFIADLSGARHNVMIEVGYALKHVETGRMLFYFQESGTCKTVPFDVNHLNYVPIVDSGEIRSKVKERIKTILTQAKNGEI